VWSRLLIFLVFCFVLCWFFVLFVFVLCLVCPMLPVSLDCSYLIAPLFFFIFIIYVHVRKNFAFWGFFLLPKTFKLFGLKYFGFGCTWGWLFQKWVVLIKSDIYFFYISGVYNNILWKLNFYTITCHESFNVSSSC